MSPVGEQTTQARKAHSLIGQVYDRRNLLRAWERVKKNKGAGGVDGVTIARFDEDLDRYLDVLHQQLKDGRYRPRPVKRVEIDKPGTTKKRPLGIPTIMDRVCQQALVQVLEPIFEPTFREASFGYRPGRSAHMAMRRIWRQLGQAEWIVDGDISDFFGSLSHERLVDLVADRVADGKVLSLIRSMLTAGALVDGVFESAVAGTPQGGVASPLLSNIYLTVFDQKMEQAGFALTRYADDWVIVCGSQSEAKRALASARAVLEGKLDLRLHSERRGSSTSPGALSSWATRSDADGDCGTRLEVPACTRSRLIARSSASRTRCARRLTGATPRTLKGCWMNSTRSSAAGATTTGARRCAGCITASTVGSCCASGTTNTSTGETPDGVICQSGGSTGNWAWSTFCN